MIANMQLRGGMKWTSVFVHWHSHINIVDAVGAVSIREVICREMCGIAC